MLKEVIGTIQATQPTQGIGEHEFRDRLVEALQHALPPEAKVMPEFRANQSRRIDIGIHYTYRGPASPGWWILGGFIGGVVKSFIPDRHRAYIEIKKDLSEQNELHRLIGQVSINQQEGYNPVVVVLFGNTNPQMKESLEEFLQPRENVQLLDLPYTSSAPSLGME